MSSEEGNLFANVLKQNRNRKTTSTNNNPVEEEKQKPVTDASTTASASKPGNMFAKLRKNSNTKDNIEETKKDANLDSLFAAAPVERKSQIGKMKRGLSDDFLSQVNQNNLINKVKEVKQTANNADGDDALSGRNSVTSNIALFQNQLNSARGGQKASSKKNVAVSHSELTATFLSSSI